MAYRQLRDFIDKLETLPSELVRIGEEVSPLFAASAILKVAGASAASPAVLFESVQGYPGVKIVGNLLGTRRRLALAMDVAPQKLNAEYLRRTENPVEPEMVDSGPVKDVIVKDVIVKDDIDILRHIPVLTHSERDSGPFITAGVVIAKQPSTRKRSMAIVRIEVKSSDRLCLSIGSRPLAGFLAEAEARGEPLDVAVAIGADPLVTIASVAHVIGAVDKFGIAGALAQRPVQLVKAETVDIEVPANAEFVIEGRVLPGVREMNGPFGESSGYYMGFETPVMEASAITYRHNPVYHATEPWSGEFESLLYSAQASMLRQLQQLMPSVLDLTLLPGSVGQTIAISLKKKTNGEARRVIAAAFGLGPQVKRVIVVDDDVDINSPREIEWAISTRFQGDEDLVVLRGADAYLIDPSAREGRLGTALGFDATKPLGNHPSFQKIASPPGYVEKARALLEKY
ncbi:MAG: UbiD family decarboxylase [Chloroflexi bacterium]|nr:UbiD family decarboxylase [Chloroflexota bacterium]